MTRNIMKVPYRSSNTFTSLRSLDAYNKFATGLRRSEPEKSRFFQGQILPYGFRLA